MSQKPHYEIRRRNDQGDLTWELWCLVSSYGAIRKTVVWDKVSEHKSDEEARTAMRAIVPTHYDKIDEYDENGASIFYGW